MVLNKTNESASGRVHTPLEEPDRPDSDRLEAAIRKLYTIRTRLLVTAGTIN